jgi:hypothetical protein
MKKSRAKAVPKWQVQITQEDIDQATPEDSSHCMIAQAVAREVGCTERWVSVDLQLIEFSDPKRHLRVAYLTPDLAQQRLLDFDAGRPVEPFTITLQRPVQVRPSELGRPAEKRAPLTPSGESRLQQRRERKEKLEARDAAGEDLTLAERSSLSRMRNTDTAGGPMAQRAPYGRKTVFTRKSKVDGGATQVRIEGGTRMAKGNRTLSNKKGRRRQYGLRQAG